MLGQYSSIKLALKPKFVAGSKVSIVNYYKKNAIKLFVKFVFFGSLTWILELFLKRVSKVEKRENPEIPDELKCISCKSAYKKILLHPCNHLCICENCMKYMKKCPVCYKKIEFFNEVNY